MFKIVKLQNSNSEYNIWNRKASKALQTEHNLLASFAGESQARSRYTLFAEKAKEEGYEQIAAVFLETAEQELSHARIFFNLLEGGTVKSRQATPQA